MMYTTRHISDYIERWAPNATKLDYDNTGLLIGNDDKPVKKVITCLDVTPAVADEAIREKADLIVAHHPIIFPKITRVTESDPTGQLVRTLIKHDIDVIAAHTNLDAARKGVSFELAGLLGLSNIDFLHRNYNNLKLVVLRFPKRLRSEIETLTEPYNLDIGWSGEEGNVLVARFNFDGFRFGAFRRKLQNALKGAPHSLDIIPMDNPSVDFGFGVIGSLTDAISAEEFLSLVENNLQCRGLRYSGDLSTTVKTVAVCGGSGSSLIQRAFGAGADAFVTADIKYHDYFIQPGKLLVDAGHYETEAPIIRKIADELGTAFPELTIRATRVNTNPMFGFSKIESSNNKST